MNENEQKTESDAGVSAEMNGTVVNSETSEWCDLLGSGSIMKKVLQKGDEETRPEMGSECVIDYICRPFDDDQTVLSEKTDFSITIGELDDIQGLDVVLSLMFLNEKSLVKFDPKFAYGVTGNLSDPKVEPNSVLVYEIHVKSIVAPCDIESLALSERKIRGNNKRVRGNWWFNRSDWQSAIQCYRKAIDYLDEKLANSDGETDENIANYSKRENELLSGDMDKELHEILNDRIKVYCNMALAQYKVGSEDNALHSFDMVLRCQPDNLKALFWKAKILGNKNEIDEAVKLLQFACKKAESLNTSSVAIRNELKRLLHLKEKNLNAERSLAKKMFRKLGTSFDENSYNVSNKKSSFWSKPKIMLMGSSAAVIISSICVYHYFFK